MEKTVFDLEKNYLIKDVAIYLRKSRGDIDTDLENHRLSLHDICNKQKLNFKEFAEVGTSDSIQDRPVFVEMLNEIREGLFDAIAVIDIDRLGRGDDEDWGKIDKILKENEILIITPDKIYDLENEEDEFHLDVKKFFARLEYKQITKRLRRGKILGAKRGKWTNGKPPFPYVYNAEEKKLYVDDDKRKVYKQILQMALSGYSAEEISWELNKNGYKSPGGKNWSSTAVYRLLYDHTHLGKIVINKTKGSGHKNKKTKPLKKIEKEDWIVVKGNHEVLKTEDEHNQIMELFARRKMIPKASRKGAFVLSGLVYCGRCGYSMQFTYNGESNIEYVKKCQKSDSVGNRCGNKGVNTNYIIIEIFAQLQELEKEIKSHKYDVSVKELETLKDSIEIKLKDLKQNTRALDTLQEQRENQEISKERFLERKKVREGNISNLKKEIAELKNRYERRAQNTDEKLLNRMKEFYDLWGNARDNKDKNRFLKTLIDKIYYTRDGDNIDIKVNFL